MSPAAQEQPVGPQNLRETSERKRKLEAANKWDPQSKKRHTGTVEQDPPVETEAQKRSSVSGIMDAIMAFSQRQLQKCYSNKESSPAAPPAGTTSDKVTTTEEAEDDDESSPGPTTLGPEKQHSTMDLAQEQIECGQDSVTTQNSQLIIAEETKSSPGTVEKDEEESSPGPTALIPGGKQGDAGESMCLSPQDQKECDQSTQDSSTHQNNNNSQSTMASTNGCMQESPTTGTSPMNKHRKQGALNAIMELSQEQKESGRMMQDDSSTQDNSSGSTTTGRESATAPTCLTTDLQKQGAWNSIMALSVRHRQSCETAQETVTTRAVATADDQEEITRSPTTTAANPPASPIAHPTSLLPVMVSPASPSSGVRSTSLLPVVSTDYGENLEGGSRHSGGTPKAGPQPKALAFHPQPTDGTRAPTHVHDKQAPQPEAPVFLHPGQRVLHQEAMELQMDDTRNLIHGAKESPTSTAIHMEDEDYSDDTEPALPHAHPAPLVLEEDKPLICNLLYLALEQMIAIHPMHFESSVGGGKDHGLACRYCTGCRHFPTSKDAITPNLLVTIIHHVRTCCLCPREIKLYMGNLVHHAPNQAINPLPNGHRSRVFVKRLWNRIQQQASPLGQEEEPTTTDSVSTSTHNIDPSAICTTTTTTATLHPGNSTASKPPVVRKYLTIRFVQRKHGTNQDTKKMLFTDVCLKVDKGITLFDAYKHKSVRGLSRWNVAQGNHDESGGDVSLLWVDPKTRKSLGQFRVSELAKISLWDFVRTASNDQRREALDPVVFVFAWGGGKKGWKL